MCTDGLITDDLVATDDTQGVRRIVSLTMVVEVGGIEVGGVEHGTGADGGDDLALPRSQSDVPKGLIVLVDIAGFKLQPEYSAMNCSISLSHSAIVSRLSEVILRQLYFAVSLFLVTLNFSTVNGMKSVVELLL